ncbi:hypothetical protein BDR03DRAFT_849829 [Suillus americanus]|nr:hypothetical protein BDR03DRAFT_849829 [Suillus americanus]
MWDDCTHHWQGNSIIMIQGHLISLNLWPQLYRYGHDNQWKGTKSKWMDWHNVVEYYWQGTPDEFWAEFTTNSKWMKFTTIVQKLHEECVGAHAAVAECACRQYSDEFADLFIYWKGGQEHLMTKPSAIAKRYEELRDCHDDRTVV